ncbi:MAG: hypothetical protein RIR76_2912, partial [Verrucomicrobiota bacterium]
MGIRRTDKTMMRMPCRASFTAAAALPPVIQLAVALDRRPL